MWKKNFVLVVLLMLSCASSLLASIRINIPATGMDIITGQNDKHWQVQGKWSYDTSPGIFQGIPEFTGQVGACNDRQISYNIREYNQKSPADYIMFTYEFNVILQGDYEINCTVSSASNGDIVRINPDGSYTSVGFQDLGGGSCKNFQMTRNLTAGRYLLRFESSDIDLYHGRLGPPHYQAYIDETAFFSVYSTGYIDGDCVPAVKVTNLTTTFNKASGDLLDIQLTSSVPSNFTWTVSSNSFVTGQSNGTGDHILHTLISSSPMTQTLTYTVTPTSIANACEGETQLFTIIISPDIVVPPCVQPVMTSIDHKTIIYGDFTSIGFSANPPSTYTWVASTNSQVSGITPSGSGNIRQTLFNHSSTEQTVTYTVTPKSIADNCVGLPQIVTITLLPPCTSDCVPCENCIGVFSPGEGAYIISAWVQESNSVGAVNYSGPMIKLNYNRDSPEFHPTGPIIDGWQRISGRFEIGAGFVPAVLVRLINTGNNEVYFDDLRIQPEKASLKSFVYDPITMRLMAELDENNYATLYEYDEEGTLIRVKKETERGIKTIKETSGNTGKKK